jgi:hypothetical protein
MILKRVENFFYNGMGEDKRGLMNLQLLGAFSSDVIISVPKLIIALTIIAITIGTGIQCITFITL